MIKGRGNSTPPLIFNNKKMIKTKHLLFISALALLLGACSGKKEKQLPILRPASMVYSSQDSADIWNLCNQFAEFFGKNDFESCALMLYKYHAGDVIPYTEEQRNDYVRKVQIFSNYGCRVESFVLNSDRNNEVALKVKLFNIGTLDDDQGISRLYLNPVKANDQWYLTLRDQNAEGVEKIYGNKE